MIAASLLAAKTKGKSKVNLKPSIHNVVLIVAIAVLGIILLRMASKTQLASLPVVGQVLKTASTA